MRNSFSSPTEFLVKNICEFSVMGDFIITFVITCVFHADKLRTRRKSFYKVVSIRVDEECM
jgi:hypothetical protein